jgi:hypothetical protein
MIPDGQALLDQTPHQRRKRFVLPSQESLPVHRLFEDFDAIKPLRVCDRGKKVTEGEISDPWTIRPRLDMALK